MPECPGCGAAVSSSARYCPSCGTKVDREYELDDGTTGDVSTEHKQRGYFIGAAATAICVILAPYFLFLVAMPESIAALSGTSIQNTLGEDAQNNPYLSGSFLIIRWFGNFLWLLVIVGIIIGMMLVL